METTTGVTGNPQHHGLGWKDALIVALALAVLLLGGVVAQRWWSEAGGEAVDTEAAHVFDVSFDRAERRYLEILFDQPLGEGLVLGR